MSKKVQNAKIKMKNDNSKIKKDLIPIYTAENEIQANI